jgi:hypothetical protein
MGGEGELMPIIERPDGSIEGTPYYSLGAPVIGGQHKRTTEQQAIVDAFLAGKNLVVEAGAGCGKSSTLRMAAIENQLHRGVYVAYNKALAEDAKRTFPMNCDCRTAHSLAYRAVGSQFQHRLNGPRLPSREVAQRLGIRGPLELSSMRIIPVWIQARAVMDTLSRFYNSDFVELQAKHVPMPLGIKDKEWGTYLDYILPLAKGAWADVQSQGGKLPFTHDAYLKMWQMNYPYIEGDYILLDEAQDASPVMADIFERQTHAQRIMVGDGAQAIYGWRGAIDAMQGFECDERLQLSQSFRFGQAIADEAAKWLPFAESNLKLRGFEPIESKLVDLSAPAAILCRTNAEVVTRAILALEEGKRVAVVGGGGALKALAEAAINLQAGRGTDHPELFLFKTWDELKEHVEEEGGELKVFVKLIESRGPQAILNMCARLVDEDRANVVISTAHKAKGREWNSVLIATDFKEPKPGDDGERGIINKHDAMLAYVSVTRAKKELDRSGLAWIDKYLQREA